MINYGNQSMNNSYEININSIIYKGNFTGYITVPINTNETLISISVRLNNETVYVQSGIKIMGNISYHAIDQMEKPNLISMNPFEWSKKEWNIFFAIVLSAIISVLIAYLVVIRYRKIHGVMEIK